MQDLPRPARRHGLLSSQQRRRARCLQSPNAFDASLSDRQRDHHGIERDPQAHRRDGALAQPRGMPVHPHRMQDRHGDPRPRVLHMVAALLDRLSDRHLPVAAAQRGGKRAGVTSRHLLGLRDRDSGPRRRHVALRLGRLARSLDGRRGIRIPHDLRRRTIQIQRALRHLGDRCLRGRLLGPPFLMQPPHRPVAHVLVQCLCRRRRVATSREALPHASPKLRRRLRRRPRPPHRRDGRDPAGLVRATRATHDLRRDVECSRQLDDPCARLLRQLHQQHVALGWPLVRADEHAADVDFANAVVATLHAAQGTEPPQTAIARLDHAR